MIEKLLALGCPGTHPLPAGDQNTQDIAAPQLQQKPLSLRQAELMPWTPYADWIFTVVSTGSILLIAWLVLRPRP